MHTPSRPLRDALALPARVALPPEAGREQHGVVRLDDRVELLARARELAAARGAEVMICFHCMESARRGPRCAKRLVEGMRALRDVGYAPQPVKVAVLEGGFDQWVRRHWRDPARVEGYDDAYWGYAEDAGDGASAPAHPLYERPAGQQATPWSDAG